MVLRRLCSRTALLAGLTVLTGIGGLATEPKIQTNGSEQLTRKAASYECDGKEKAMRLPSLDSPSGFLQRRSALPALPDNTSPL